MPALRPVAQTHPGRTRKKCRIFGWNRFEKNIHPRLLFSSAAVSPKQNLRSQSTSRNTLQPWDRAPHLRGAKQLGAPFSNPPSVAKRIATPIQPTKGLPANLRRYHIPSPSAHPPETDDRNPSPCTRCTNNKRSLWWVIFKSPRNEPTPPHNPFRIRPHRTSNPRR